MVSRATENDFIDQIRLRVTDGERIFRSDLEALKSSQAAKGMLRSGATIARTLSLFEAKFAELTDIVVAYLGRALERTELDRDDLLTLTSQALTQSLAAYKSLCDRGTLVGFSPGKGIDRVIGEAFARADERLTLRLREFAIGLSEERQGPGTEAIPAANRYVSIADNQRGEFAAELSLLKDQTRGDNEAAEEDRLIALSEIAAFEQTIIQPRVSTDLIERFVELVLGWIRRAFTTAAIQEVAQRLIQALMKIVN